MYKKVFAPFLAINRVIESILLPIYPAVACGQFFLLIFLSLFGVTSIFVVELLLHIHAVVAILTLVVALVVDGHVRVDIVYRYLTTRQQMFIHLCGSVICLSTTGLVIAWLGGKFALFSLLFWETSSTPSGLHGIFIFKTFIPIVGLLLFLEGCIQAYRAFVSLRGQ